MSNLLNKAPFLAFLLFVLIFYGQETNAQASVSLSVTPTLFDVSVDPGQTWRSSVRVINPNDDTLTVFIEPVLFSAAGERGISTFSRLDQSESQGITLAEWFELNETVLTIPSQDTAQLTFSVSVPEDAAPGGQYAALLVSTQPPPDVADGSQVRTTQAVSSLFFMRVSGDIDELGRIRSFRADQSVVNRPQNDFTLRFENQGTVHLLPQGTITIYNMWGQPRGEIPVNQRSQFGKVLPETIRSYEFGWEGSFSLLDIGRYRAEVTLGYGEQQRAFVSADTAFWVIPWTGLLVVVGSLVMLVIISSWLIRRYIRRVLLLSGVDPADHRGIKVQAGDIKLSDLQTTDYQTNTETVSKNSKDWFAPFKIIRTELRDTLSKTTSLKERIVAFIQLVSIYKWVLLGLLLLISLLFVGVLFGRVVFDTDRGFEVTITTGDTDQVVSSEEIILERLNLEPPATKILSNTEALDAFVAQETLISITNVAGTPGVAAHVAYELSQHMPESNILVSVDINRSTRRSVVLYSPEQMELAQALSQALGGALLSAYPEDVSDDTPVSILIGTDLSP